MNEPVFVGVDVGSSATKCVVLNDNVVAIGHHVVSSGFDYVEAIASALSGALTDAGAVESDIAGCVATGYGRQHVEIADRTLTEISCHARGAREWYPSVRNIVDIGGQDTKIIRLGADGRMIDYRMNAKCAAGTGTFLESIAAKLGLPLTEIDRLALESTRDTVVNSYCTVFAATEVIERIKEGQAKEDISMGLFRSIAARVCEMLPAHDGAVSVTGGVVAHCRAMVVALEEALNTEVMLPPKPQFAGAFGAALIALESHKPQGTTASHVARG